MRLFNLFGTKPTENVELIPELSENVQGEGNEETASPEEEKKDAETAGPPISQRTLCIVLAGCLLIGAITPSVEFFRGARQVSRRGIFDKETDSLYTIGGDGPYELEDDSVQTNFVSLDLDEQIFFRYFAK